MSEKTWEVSIYITQSINSPKRQDGTYGYVIETNTSSKKTTIEDFGVEGNCTAHELELLAITDAIRRLTKKCVVTIYSPHGFFKNAIVNHWLDNWKKSNWKNAKDEPVKNKEIWQELSKELEKHSIIVAGGNTHEYHEWMQNELKRRKSDV